METLPNIELLRLGSEGHGVAVIDGFASDAEKWRQAATEAEFRNMGDFYPGRRAPVPAAYLEATGPLIGAVLRRAFGCTARLEVERALYSIVSTPAAELGLAQRIPHIDSAAPGRFALVHYLSPSDWGGTAFYRHRSTGFEGITPGRHRSYLDRLEQEFASAGPPSADYIAGDTAQFACIGQVGHRFNRAVIYPANLLHCSATRSHLAHPDDPLVGRLTVAVFMAAG